MESNYWVRFCADCSLCKYTRTCKRKAVLYYLARLIEKICPWCYMANRTLKKDFQAPQSKGAV